MSSETMNVILADFAPLRIGNPLKQKVALNYTAWVMAVSRCQENGITDGSTANSIYQEFKEKFAHFGVSADMIDQRQLLVFPEMLSAPETGNRELEYPMFNPKAQETMRGAPLEERMSYFNDLTSQCFDAFYSDQEQKPDGIIHVTCSGYLSPSPPQTLISKKGWSDTTITHSYHMGCYGAFPPVQMATGFLAASHFVLPNKKRKIDIVHTELLSIHGDFTKDDPGSIVNLSLFSDGFIKYSSYSDEAFREKQNRSTGLKILASHDYLIKDSLHEMTWVPNAFNFEMYLSKNVPICIRDAIAPFVKQLCTQGGIDFERESDDLIFAIHPGGPKILNHIRDSLGIDESQMKWSRDVLFNNGNMSSATIPHIWQAILEDEDVKPGQRIVSMAFGPGLTATGLVFEKMN